MLEASRRLALLTALALALPACGDQSPATESADNPSTTSSQVAEHTFQVRSEPAATLYVDGKEIGTTPIETAVAAGSHEIRLVAEGHEAWIENVKVDAATELVRPLKLEQLNPESFERVALALGLEPEAWEAPGTHRGSSDFEVLLYWPSKDIRKEGLRTMRMDVGPEYGDVLGKLMFKQGRKVLYEENFDSEDSYVLRSIPAQVLANVKVGKTYEWGIYFDRRNKKDITTKFRVIRGDQATKRLEKLAKRKYFQRQAPLLQELLIAQTMQDKKLYSESFVHYLSVLQEWPDSTQPYRGIIGSMRRLKLKKSDLYQQVASIVGGAGGRAGAGSGLGGSAGTGGLGGSAGSGGIGGATSGGSLGADTGTGGLDGMTASNPSRSNMNTIFAAPPLHAPSGPTAAGAGVAPGQGESDVEVIRAPEDDGALDAPDTRDPEYINPDDVIREDMERGPDGESKDGESKDGDKKDGDKTEDGPMVEPGMPGAEPETKAEQKPGADIGGGAIGGPAAPVEVPPVVQEAQRDANMAQSASESANELLARKLDDLNQAAPGGDIHNFPPGSPEWNAAQAELAPLEANAAAAAAEYESKRSAVEALVNEISGVTPATERDVLLGANAESGATPGAIAGGPASASSDAVREMMGTLESYAGSDPATGPLGAMRTQLQAAAAAEQAANQAQGVRQTASDALGAAQAAAAGLPGTASEAQRQHAQNAVDAAQAALDAADSDYATKSDVATAKGNEVSSLRAALAGVAQAIQDNPGDFSSEAQAALETVIGE